MNKAIENNAAGIKFDNRVKAAAARRENLRITATNDAAKMTLAKFNTGVAEFHGWIEGDTAYFPSVVMRVQFEKWFAAQS